ncbi:hypothetical protein PY650_28875 [Rhizobium calliandrae]|uniref:Uncharacterized protein n=1 Tax=Rhizobium calliandrae TaxID=1312182 RepID=A0ABT7KMC4_9HYPH|nr:hypothetical protein [Rhizobium calliandrae]MDL2409571.1 hypothetical protein [Rhizobium calliandrae]
MADSEISRVLPAFSNRNMLSKVAQFLKNNLPSAVLSAPSAAIPTRRGDPALSVWSEWYLAHGNATRLGRIQARLETKLFSKVPSLRLELSVGGREQTVTVRTEEEIERLLVGEDLAIVRANAKAELSARRAVWQAADEKLGFSAAKDAEGKAMELDDDIAERLWDTRALTLAGVIGKLHAMLAKGQPSHESEEFPWPQIRSVVEDLISIDAGTKH